MDNSLILQDKNYISARQVQDLFGYTSDYVGQLCRAGKLEAKMIGRSWFVTEKSLIDYKNKIAEISRQKNKQKRILSKKIYKSQIDPNVQTKDQIKLDPPANFIPEKEPLKYSPLKVEAENLTPIPLLKKNSPSTPIQVPVQVPSSTYLSSLALSDKNKFITMAIASSVFAIFFIYISVNPIKNISTNNIQASLQSISSDVVSVFSNSIKSLSSKFAGLFTPKEMNIVVKNTDLESDVTKSGNNEFRGIAVVPSTKSEVQDEIVKQKIRDSFSDEVVVRPDDSGTAGAITPVFRKASGDDFVYVLVPVQDSGD